MSLRETLYRRLATMRRTIVHDPEHTARCVVRGLAHDLIDQALERGDAGSRFAAAEHLGVMYVQCRQVGPSTATGVLMFHAHCLGRCGWQAWMDAQACLNAGFLVGRDDELVFAQRLSLPAPFVQIQDSSSLGLEMRIARKYPAAVLPGANRVFVQPPPDSAVADARHQTRALRVSCHIGHAESRQWQAQGGRRFTRERLDLNRELWGEKPAGVPGGLALRGPPFAP